MVGRTHAVSPPAATIANSRAAAPASKESADDERQRDLQRLQTKALGTVEEDAARHNAALAEMLRAICDRVTLGAHGHLGCDACVGCLDTETMQPSAVTITVSGRFLNVPARQALVAMWAGLGAAYDYRYFVLVQRNTGWRVAGTVVLVGLPVEQQVLHVPGKPDLLVRTTVGAGAPNPTTVEAVDFSGAEVRVTTFASDLLPINGCAPAALGPDRVVLRDANADGREDVVLQLKDYSDTLASAAAMRRLEQACAGGQPANEAWRSRRLVFSYDGIAFTGSPLAVSLLGLEGTRVEPSLQAWEAAPKE